MYQNFLPLIAYLIGSVSTAIVVSRLWGIKDPRHVGSRNPGATNILRYGGKVPAAVTLLGDVFKGVVPVLLARALSDNDFIISAAVVCVFLGHLYPVFFGFRGGKGVATALGAWLALSPWVGLAFILTWLTVAAVSRYSSLSALVAAALAPVYVWLFRPGVYYLLAIMIMSGLLFWRHRSNIHNLLTGEEKKITSFKKL